MNPLRAGLLLASLAAAGAVFGGGVGWIVGSVAPGYYRVLYQSRLDAEFDAVQMGVGLGAGQGAAAGVILGLLLVGFVTWSSGTGRKAENGGLSSESTTIRSRLFVILKRVVLALVLLSVGFLSFLAGGIVGQTDIYNRRAAHEERLISERLSSNPDSSNFGDIRYDQTSDGHAVISGSVRTKADHDQLYRELQDLFGTDRASELSAGVSVSFPKQSVEESPNPSE